MEKFRKHSDAATGINPFVPGALPPLSYVALPLWILLVPIRVVLLLLLTVILFLLDVTMHFLRIAALGRFVAAPIVFPLTVYVGQAFLFCLTGISSKVRLLTPKPSALSPEKDGIRSPKPGDLVLANLVTPLDAFLLSTTQFSRNGDHWGMPFSLIGIYSPVQPHLAVFGPSPLQRWKVLRHILWCTEDSFLLKCANAPRVEDVALEIAPVQARGRQLGIPILLFPEGTTTNGKGILQWAQKMQCDPSQTVSLVSVTYTGGIATQRVTSSMTSLTSWILRSWLQAPSTVFVTLARPGNGPLPLESNGAQDADWVLDTRQRMAYAAEFRHAGDHVCKVVKLQCHEKAAFALHFRETNGSGAKAVAPAPVETTAAAPTSPSRPLVPPPMGRLRKQK